MVNFDEHSHLDNLLQKSLSYLRHRDNYILNLREEVIPTRLKNLPLTISLTDLNYNGITYFMSQKNG